MPPQYPLTNCSIPDPDGTLLNRRDILRQFAQRP